MMRHIVYLLLFLPSLVFGQDYLMGVVKDSSNQSPLFGTVVYWEGTNNASISDEHGVFKIEKDSSSQILVVEYTGYLTRKFKVTDEKQIVVLLSALHKEIQTVEIKIEKPTVSINFYGTIKEESLNEHALKKAACCNLSESFETNPTVDVSFSDAVTGTKQIQLLGLAGPYALITTGNIPTNVGNSSVVGLNFIPGQWLSSIQLIKGTGSVVNGYQSIAGQINAEYKNSRDQKIFVNAYGNGAATGELNVILPYHISSTLSSALFIQADNGFREMDNNNDGFIDNQIGSKIVLMNTFDYSSDSSNWESKSGIKFEHLDKESGQLFAIKNRYQFLNQQNKLEGWMKLGYLFDAPGRSMGLQVDLSGDEKYLKFGHRDLKAQQNKLYLNWIYADILVNSNHTIKSGVTYKNDQLRNQFDSLSYNWNEQVLGAFAEYTFKPSHKFSLVSGFRADYSTVFDWIVTPRLHGRWEISEKNVLRFSAGLGTKNPNPFMESFGVFASSRKIVLSDLQQERALNTGVNYTYKFELKERHFTFSSDYYYTYFYNKVI